MPPPPHFSAPHLQRQPAPPTRKKSGRHGILIGALVFIATLIVAGGVVAFVEVTKQDDSASSGPSTAAAGGADFTGTYRADYGPGSDLKRQTGPECAGDDQQLGYPIGVRCRRLRGDGGECQRQCALVRT